MNKENENDDEINAKSEKRIISNKEKMELQKRLMARHGMSGELKQRLRTFFPNTKSSKTLFGLDFKRLRNG